MPDVRTERGAGGSAHGVSVRTVRREADRHGQHHRVVVAANPRPAHTAVERRDRAASTARQPPDRADTVANRFFS